MDELIIDAKNLKRTFKVSQREKTGLFSSLKSLIIRKYVYVEAVSGINIQIAKGEIRGLIGPNGAGKSTTIKILSGVLHPSSGLVKVMGFTPWLEREEYVRHIGVVFGQKSQLWWDLPPIDTFSLNRKMYRIPDRVFRENLEYFKEILDIGNVITRPTRQLSLGERMKCELVCAMLHDPPLVFLDEPTIGLDVLSKDAIRRFIKQTNQKKRTTFILTTHDLADIEDLCENVTVINKGGIIYNGTLHNMKSFVSNKKTVEIKFAKPVTMEMLAGFKLISFNPLDVTVEIKPENGSIQSKLNQLISSLPVRDININDISIEEVIKQIYTA